MTLNDISDGGKHLLDALSIAAVVGTLADMLPPIAALFAIAWTSLQIFTWIEARLAKRKLPKD